MTTRKTHDDEGTTDTGITRRRFGEIALGVGIGLGAGTANAEVRKGEEPFRALGRGPVTRPNILFILADDLGWADLSSYGALDTNTPSLDRLAREGIRFTDAYSGSAVCSPTRFSLYTGRYPGRLPGGLPEPIASASPEDGIPPSHPTLASLLRDVGYHTALIGKWHCGYLPWFSPLKSGWNEFFGNLSGAIDYFSHVSFDGTSDLYEAEVPVERIGYYTELLTQRAVEFLERDQGAPWLLNLNYTTPHWPWEGPDDEAESRRLTALTLEDPDSFAIFHSDGGSLAVFAEMVASLDRSIGAVLRALERSGQERNTIVVFSSDNGGERFSFQWPLRDAKGSLYEGGIRVPNIVRWPGVLGRRQVSNVPIFTADWTATLLQIGGAVPSPSYPLDGASLIPLLLYGEPPPQRDLFWRMQGQRALRRGNWKYVALTGPRGLRHELYDLSRDPSERANLASRESTLLTELRAAWESIDATLLPYPA